MESRGPKKAPRLAGRGSSRKQRLNVSGAANLFLTKLQAIQRQLAAKTSELAIGFASRMPALRRYLSEMWMPLAKPLAAAAAVLAKDKVAFT